MTLLERDIETQIDRQLRNLEWNDNSKDTECNVFKQRPKTEEQRKALQGKRPDYVLYRDNTNNPLIVIEAKKPQRNIQEALLQGIDYAKKLKAPIVFATDGVFTKTFHLEKQRPLYLNKDEVDDLIRQSLAIQYIHDNEYISVDKKVIQSREELIGIFKGINNQFRDAGISSGLPRIELFCNMLFLKVISELSATNSLIKTLPEWCSWDKIKEKKGEELRTFINGQAFDHFKEAYGGDVLSPIEGLVKPNILDTIVKKLDDLHLSATNTDIKGDAFEYFLRNYGGANTDFGEYFTPRHVVKTLVKLLNPMFGEKVYDPFCGTGGMLITAYKHIYERMPRNETSIKQLKEATIYGGEITKMYRIAKMNMILAGDGHSNILNQDSYGSPQKGKYDVVITNMPFGKSMKTDYAGLYGFDTPSAEITGVLHCLDALNESDNARAGILVPEGILFDTSKAYTKLRENIVEQHSLETVVSLPAQTFAPNTGVKSDILIVKKRKNTEKKHIWYFNVKNDGYTLDTARRKTEGLNDFDTLLSETVLSTEEKEKLSQLNFSVLWKDEIKEKNYTLLSRKNTEHNLNSKYPMVALDEVFLEIKNGKNVSQNKERGKYLVTRIETISDGVVNLNRIGFTDDIVSEDYFLRQSDILLSHINSSAHLCKSAIYMGERKDIIHGINLLKLRANKEVLNPQYAIYILKSRKFIEKAMVFEQKAVDQSSINITNLKTLSIPIPPIEEQKRIVDELNKIEQTITNARQLLNSYQPTIITESNWGIVKLGDVCNITGGYPAPQDDGCFLEGLYPFFRVSDIANEHCTGDLLKSWDLLNTKGTQGMTISKKGTVLIPKSGASTKLNHRAMLGIDGYVVSHCACLYPKDADKLLCKYLYYVSLSIDANEILNNEGYPSLTLEAIGNIIIPLPPLEEQVKIVKELDSEQAIIDQNKKLIESLEAKIRAKIESLWQEA